MVNFERVGNKNDSFVLAKQVNQVIYISDPADLNWSIVLAAKPRHGGNDYGEDVLYEGIRNIPIPDISNDPNEACYVRTDHDEGEFLNEIPKSKGKSKTQKRRRKGVVLNISIIFIF